jgi:hypothetical protein
MNEMEEYKGYKIQLNSAGVFEAYRKDEDRSYEEVGSAETFKGIKEIIDKICKTKLGIEVIIDVNGYGESNRLYLGKLSSIKDTGYNAYRVVIPNQRGYKSVDTIYKANAGNKILMDRINKAREEKETLEAKIETDKENLEQIDKADLGVE